MHVNNERQLWNLSLFYRLSIKNWGHGVKERPPMPPVCDIGLRGYRVLRSESNRQVLVHLELEREPDCCRCCASPRIVAKGRYRRRARHLNSFGLPSLLQIETRRFECRACGRSFLPETPGLRPWKRSTEPWRQKVYIQHHEGICASALARLMKLGSATRRAHLRGIYFSQGQGTFESAMPSGSRYRRAHPSQGATFCHHLL